MTNIAEVRLWGNTIGAIALEDDARFAVFQFDPKFAQSNIEVSPLVMPLSEKVYQFTDLEYETFRGLPGLLADSLPDRFGNALIDSWLAQQGRTPESFNAIERLCYIGNRGMGALEYQPATGSDRTRSEILQVEELVELASMILSQREELNVLFKEPEREQALLGILQIGTSAGGQRPKAVIAWNPKTNEVRSGQIKADKDFEYWILKFDGITNSKDEAIQSPQGHGQIEYAYFLMARDAGITIEDSRLFEENGRRHFMTKRFDRLTGGEKIHMQTLGSLSHYDYRLAGAYSYEQAFMVMRQLGLPIHDVEEQFRRMVFNVLARNQDDHVKNIAFVMDKSGTWSLSPAYDLTFSYNPMGKWTANHQMSINGKRDEFSIEDLLACGKAASIKNRKARSIMDEVAQSVTQWNKYADAANVPSSRRDEINRLLRMELV